MLVCVLILNKIRTATAQEKSEKEQKIRDDNGEGSGAYQSLSPPRPPLPKQLSALSVCLFLFFLCLFLFLFDARVRFSSVWNCQHNIVVAVVNFAVSVLVCLSLAPIRRNNSTVSGKTSFCWSFQSFPKNKLRLLFLAHSHSQPTTVETALTSLRFEPSSNVCCRIGF